MRSFWWAFLTAVIFVAVVRMLPILQSKMLAPSVIREAERIVEG